MQTAGPQTRLLQPGQDEQAVVVVVVRNIPGETKPRRDIRKTLPDLHLALCLHPENRTDTPFRKLCLGILDSNVCLAHPGHPVQGDGAKGLRGSFVEMLLNFVDDIVPVEEP